MTDQQGSELELFFRNGKDPTDGVQGALHICSANPENTVFLQELQELMDAAIDLGVEEGLWKKEDGPRVRSPLEIDTDEDGRATPGRLVLIADDVQGFVGDAAAELDGMLGKTFTHTEIEFVPLLDEDGTPRVVCCLDVHLDAPAEE